jgi:hypothetical protein
MSQYNNLAETVNGVDLPRNVVLELQRLGLALEWYTQHELESSVRACAVDNKLIDDPNGINFADKIELTHEEKTFRERLEQERENVISADGINNDSKK